MNRERSLLFGIFAVQLKRVTPAQLMEVAAAWAVDPTKTLSERLVESGLITPEDRAMLEDLVEHAIDAHNGDAVATLEAVRGTEQVYQSLDSSMTRSTLRMDQIFGELQDLGSAAGIELPRQFEAPGRYTIRHEHARGGQGRLLLVHDEQLGRDVILKELLRARVTAPDAPTPVRGSAHAVARFLQEAKITGQLDHPCIVPVYELGLRHDGHPYYTMKLVKGDTFHAMLRRSATLDQRLRYVKNFLDVCQGVAYAHSRGVIHRDLKPLNVMVGQFGETVILDWGLAKVKGKEDARAQTMAETLSELRDRAKSSSETSDGAVIGTPAYMAPKQARGDIDLVDERSDVYSLGVFLYHIITGQTPFQGRETWDVLDLVANDRPVSCLKLQPDAPVELAAICERCMQPDPKNRYRNAKELAEEVERYLTGALVRAHQYSFGQMLKRYYRRNKIQVRMAVASLAILAAVGLYSYVRVVQARNDAVTAWGVAENEKYITQMRLVQSYMDMNDHELARKTLAATNPNLRNWEWGYLTNRCNQELLVLEETNNAAINPDGTRIATTSRGGEVRVHDATDGKVLVRFAEGLDQPLDIAYSPDGRKLLGYSLGNVVRVWNAESGDVIATFKGHTGTISSAVFDPAGQRVLTTASDGTARIWDLQTGDQALTYTALPRVSVSDFSPDGKWVSSTGYLSNAAAPGAQALESTVWNSATGAELLRVAGGPADWAPDGERIVVANDVLATVYAFGDTLQPISALEGHTAQVRSVEFSQNGQRVLTRSADGSARVFDAATGEEISRLNDVDPIYAARFVPDNEHVVTYLSGDHTSSIAVWNIYTSRKINTPQGYRFMPRELFLSAKGDRLISESLDQTARVWNALNTPGQRVLPVSGKAAIASAISPDGALVAVAQDNRAIEVLDIESGALVATLAGYSLSGASAVAISPGNSRLVAAADEFTLLVWNIDDQALLSRFLEHEARIQSVVFSPDGVKVASASYDGSVRVWEAATGSELFELRGHTAPVNAVAYSPDGRTIATASADKSARIWDAATGQELRVLTGHEDAVLCVAFDSAGLRLASGSADRNVLIWSTIDFADPKLLEGHLDGIHHLGFSDDGLRLASIGGDGTVRVWDSTTTDELLTLRFPGRRVGSGLRFLPGSNRLCFVSQEGDAHIWEAAPWSTVTKAGVAEAATHNPAVAANQAAATPSNRREPVEIPVITTPETLSACLRRLADAVRGRPAPAGPAQSNGGLKCEGDIFNALAKLTAQPKDAVLAVNDVSVYDPAFSAEISRMAGEIQYVSATTPTLKIRRAGKERVLRPVLVEATTKTMTRRLPRAEAVEFFKLQAERLEKYAANTIRQNQMYAANIGEPAQGDRRLNGIWIPADTELEKIKLESYYRDMGLALNDRIVQIDGSPVTDLDRLLQWCRDMAPGIAGGGSSGFEMNVERGGLQRLRVRVQVD